MTTLYYTPQATLDLVRVDVPVTGVQDSINRVFTVPEKFVSDSIQLFHNGRKLTKLIGTSGDFTVGESAGLGTGFDEITLVSFAPKVSSVLRVNYVISVT